jgi:uncharacterized protein YndB with AHSA1/START domain
MNELTFADDAHHATHRAIGRKQIPAGAARTAIIRREYDAPIEDVWEACTEPDRINRWFLRVTGDLREGGTFDLDGNAHGEILRCQPPRRLTLSWIYGDRPADEVELRLASTADGRTVLEIEHASVSDVVLNDPEAGLWGVGIGWEVPLVYALTPYLAGELPDAPAAEWFEVTPAFEAVGERVGAAWIEVANAAAAADRAELAP